MRIGPLAPTRIARVAELSARCFEHPWTADELAREVERAVARVLVAEQDGAPIAYGVAYVIAGESEVLTIGVDPLCRRTGVGRALLMALLEDCERASLEVRADNLAAVALYERSGFERVDVRRGYYADGQDAWVMAWTRPPSP